MTTDLRALVEKWRADADEHIEPRNALEQAMLYGVTKALRMCADELQAALDAQAGMVMVPRVPTEAMLEAGRDAVMARDCSGPKWGPADHYKAAGISRKGMPEHLFEGKGKMSKAWGAELVYAAMLAAAPSGPVEGGEDG